ncbi:MAG: DUF4402 domain-containing protein [Acidobacteria bacterium]|nr:DUF4402 domain-containing protein [Acidobacteriota bacterium]
MKRLLAVSLVSLVAATAAYADGLSATATATASARFIQPISITKTADLGFGIIITGPSGGMGISANGEQFPNNVEVLPGNVSNARFTVSGEPNLSYSIVLPASATISNGAQTMLINNFVSNPSGTGTLSASGTQEVGVGAYLIIAEPNQAPGDYSGTFAVTVMY